MCKILKLSGIGNIVIVAGSVHFKFGEYFFGGRMNEYKSNCTSSLNNFFYVFLR